MQEKTLTYEQLINLFQEDRKQFQEIKEAQAKTDAQLAETNRYIKELGIQIGGVHSSFGKFTEELFMSSLELMMKSNFGIQSFDSNPSRKLDSDSIEIDAMGIINGSVNKVYIAEIKSNYSKKALKQLNKILDKFNSFYPELSDKKKFGIIAVPFLKDEQIKEISNAGFYPAVFKNDMLVLQTSKNFKAKAF
ncbi:MAG: hypothetical protein NTW25_11445 [Candidatus Kapabacteria bacterium]|nr:hypothetical protein [Candidatus Kapabacteria bacterium]